MRYKVAMIPAVSLLALAGSAVAGTSVSSASTTSVDLAMSGSVVAGVTSAQLGSGQELAFSFTMKNRSSSTTADVSFDFTITNGTADSSDYICPLIPSRADINPDTPSCEPGALGPGKSSSAAILVTVGNASPLVVKACASNLDGYSDPTPSNNCKTLKVSLS